MKSLIQCRALVQVCIRVCSLCGSYFLAAHNVEGIDPSPISVTPEMIERAKSQFGSEEVTKALNEIADAIEANRKKFPHAVGQFDISNLNGPASLSPDRIMWGTVDFWYADSGRTFRCRFKYDRMTGPGTSASLSRLESIVTPEHYVKFTPGWKIAQLREFPPVDGFADHPGPIAYRSDARDARGSKWSDALSAGSLLYLSQEQPAEAYCRLVSQFYKGKKEDWGSAPKCFVNIQTEGSRRITKLVLLGPDVAKAVSPSSACIVFDSEVGNLPIRYTSFKDGRMDLDEEWAYERRQEGYFPSEHRHTTFENGEVSHERRLKTVSIDFAEPKKSEFEINVLNFKYGDRLHDKLKRELSVFDGEKFVPASEFKYDEQKAAEK